MNKSNKARVSKLTNSPQSVGGNGSPQSRNTTPSRSKSDKEVPYEGIYQNLRFCETITSLMGNTVQIQLSNGKIFEGIFSTFSPQLEVVLELVHTVDPNQPDKIDVATVAREVVFGSQMIVMMSSKDVELDYATKDFATDTSISRFNGISGEKELEPWEGDGDDCNLSLDNANGWDPNEMFARNEKVYGVQSSFEQDLSQYTCKLERRDSAEFKEREAQAAMLANSIEGNSSSKAQLELENASDEEEKFSAVVRPNHGSSSGGGSSEQTRERRDYRDFGERTRSSLGAGGTSANSSGGQYVPPNKRPPNKSGMQSMGKMMRSTPPPHSTHGTHGHSSNLAPRHQSAGGGSYHGGGNNYDSNNSGPGVHHGGGGGGGGYQHQPFQGAGRGRGGSSAGSGPYYNRSQGGPPGGYNSTRNNSNQQSSSESSSRLANGEEQRKANRESSYDTLNKTGGHASSNLPPRDHGPKEQRKGYAGKSRDDQHSDLKRFGQDFRLALTSPATDTAPADEKKTTPSPTVAAAPAPSAVSNSTNKNNSPTPPAAAPTTTASVPPAQASQPTTQPAVITAGQPSGRSPVVSPVLTTSSTTPVTQTTPPATSSAPSAGQSGSTRETTPVEDGKATPASSNTAATAATPSSEPVDKVSETLKKSSLNPNAKEFVLNPNARVFIPTPPRSHTPQTQQGGGQILMPAPMASMGPVAPGMGGPANPGQPLSLMPVVHYVPANPGAVVPTPGPGSAGAAAGGAGNPPQFPAHNPGAQRFRKPSPMPVNHRPDLASSMHVAAATGQPLMAPAPMGGPQLFYPPQGAMIPGTPQPYAQMFTMRLVGPQMQMQVPNSAYADSPTTGHGPIYMSPGPGGQAVASQGQMGPPQPQQQQHGGHPNSAPSPAQQHSMAGPTPSGNPPQLIYQTAGGHHGHNPGPPHNHPHHASFPMLFLPPGPTQMPPGGPSGGPGAPQGVQILPLGSSAATGMAMAHGMAIPQIHYIQQAPGNQAVHRLA